MIFKPYFGEYEIANLIRIGGAGLGNLLFPLCRAYIYSKRHNSVILPPIWPSFKIGPLLRREKEKRNYTGLFKFNFIERCSIQFQSTRFERITEDTYLDKYKNYSAQSKVCVKVQGLKSYFDDLVGYNEELLQYILKISSDKTLALYKKFNSDNVGVHIRLGDYNEDSRTPISWYVNTIIELQKHPTFLNSKFIIFSDGKDEELKDILALKNCFRIVTPNALADILRLSKCKLIIGSNSTFSAWATFLGKTPFIRHEKFYMKKIHAIEHNIYEGSTVRDFFSFKNSH